MISVGTSLQFRARGKAIRPCAAQVTRWLELASGAASFQHAGDLPRVHGRVRERCLRVMPLPARPRGNRHLMRAARPRGISALPSHDRMRTRPLCDGSGQAARTFTEEADAVLRTPSGR
jgi:hypothetical protein